ncbi:MAG: MBL fold metallo-hydrolase [Planctomycetota bacterium]
MDYRVISIGTLSVNPLWDKKGAARTAHATTTLIRTPQATILVDPALPPQAIAARLEERSGLTPDDITHVFLTCFRPAHRMGLEAFADTKWWIAEAEREGVGQSLVAMFNEAKEEEQREWLRQEIALLQRFEAAPDSLAPHVDLFPLPGSSPGGAGLLLVLPNQTVLVAGDAVATDEHLQRGQVLDSAFDIEQARDSFTEAVEIADLIIPGHDNLLQNPLRRM